MGKDARRKRDDPPSSTSASSSHTPTAAELVRRHQKRKASSSSNDEVETTRAPTKASKITSPRKVRAAAAKKSASSSGTDTATSMSVPEAESVDLDEEIRRLEQELANDCDDEEDEDNSDEDDDERLEHRTTINSEKSATVLSLSALKDATIERLPASQLPSIPNKKRKDDQYTQRDATTRSKTSPKQSTVSPDEQQSGLETAVRELLRDYKPRSAERLPFYCRVCAQQYHDEATFTAHKLEPFHVTAVALERKASTCKLCRKTFTSPVQLTEHVKSKPHLERLRTVQSKQKGPPQRASASAAAPPRHNRPHHRTNQPMQRR